MTGATVREDRPAVEWALLIARVVVGGIFAAHGAQLVFGAFGGPGIAAMGQMMGPIGYLVAIGQFFGGLGIAVGFLSRFSAASLIVIMIGAIAMVHAKNGFFLMDAQHPDPQKVGFEYNVALIGLLAPILIAGPGCLSIGRFLPLPGVKDTGRPILPIE